MKGTVALFLIRERSLPASWFSRVNGHLAAKELGEANLGVPLPGMLLNWPCHSGITESYLRRMLMDEAKDGCDRTAECPLSQSHGAAVKRKKSKGQGVPFPGSVMASSA